MKTVQKGNILDCLICLDSINTVATSVHKGKIWNPSSMSFEFLIFV